ncbi:MAG: hypothetical protein Q8K36_00335 [Alphaproteobacteria bacterium]|nr:hypothetical protein [Alphaproteobacteria bacterium]
MPVKAGVTPQDIQERIKASAEKVRQEQDRAEALKLGEDKTRQDDLQRRDSVRMLGETYKGIQSTKTTETISRDGEASIILHALYRERLTTFKKIAEAFTRKYEMNLSRDEKLTRLILDIHSKTPMTLLESKIISHILGLEVIPYDKERGRADFKSTDEWMNSPERNGWYALQEWLVEAGKLKANSLKKNSKKTPLILPLAIKYLGNTFTRQDAIQALENLINKFLVGAADFGVDLSEDFIKAGGQFPAPTAESAAAAADASPEVEATASDSDTWEVVDESK